MQSLILGEVPQTGVIPSVKRLRVKVRVVSAKPGETKKKEPKFDLGLEIFSPEKVKDLTGNTVVVAGLKTTLSLIFDGKGMPGTAQFHSKMGLPLSIEAGSEEEFNTQMQELYTTNGLAFEVFLSSEESELKEHNPETGESEPAKDENGEPMKGGFRWSTIWANDVVRKVEDPGSL